MPREEVELDTESFDYIFYNLGMERYGNTPLIEPLEYKEVNRLEELVIAIDTSSLLKSGQSGDFWEKLTGYWRRRKIFSER